MQVEISNLDLRVSSAGEGDRCCESTPLFGEWENVDETQKARALGQSPANKITYRMHMRIQKCNKML